MSPALWPAAAGRPALALHASGSGGSRHASGGRRAGPRGLGEPIRVAVRLRPLRGDGGEGERSPERAESSPTWRAEKVGGQHWVYLSAGTPRLPVVAFGGGGSSGPSASAGAAACAVLRPSHERARFCVDFCFDGKTPNREVFEAAARDVIRSSFNGLNATVLAYGQTNSGKTHSILGTLREPGVLPLAMHDLFECEGGTHMAGLVARVSYFEIFNERVIDLLANGQGGDRAHLPVKEDVDRGFYVQGLSEAPVHSAKDVLRLIERGEDRRRYAQTRWNEYSSRSHVLFTLTLERPPHLRGAGEPSAGDPCAGQEQIGALVPGQTAKVSIVDLAGCENHKFEPSEDGRYINRSLFFLGEVISRLCSASAAARDGREQRSGSRRGTRESAPHRRLTPVDSQAAAAAAAGQPPRDAPSVASGQDSPPAARRGREGERAGAAAAPAASRSPSRGSRERSVDFIPYRDSKLTRILRSSLGGNAVTLLLVTVHPATQFVEQSLTSLRFATKARCVENYVTPGPECAVRTDEQSMIDAQQRIIEGLQQKLRTLELQRGPSKGIPYGPSQIAEVKTQLERAPGGIWGSRPHGGDAVFQDMMQNGLLDQWMVRQFQGLRHELEAKEQQLAAKTRLLSERERQLGQLRERLGDWCAPGTNETCSLAEGPSTEPGGSPGSSAAARRARPGPEAAGPGPRATPQSRRAPPTAIDAPPPRPRPTLAGAPRHGAPDEGGGLPVVDISGVPLQPQPLLRADPPPLRQSAWPPPASGIGGEMSGGGMADASAAADAAASLSRSTEAPTAFQQVQSRAEDIVCLRSSYVSRQQMPMTGSSPSPPGGTAGDAGGQEAQKELVERLLYLAVQQINSVKADSSVSDKTSAGTLGAAILRQSRACSGQTAEQQLCAGGVRGQSEGGAERVGAYGDLHRSGDTHWEEEESSTKEVEPWEGCSDHMQRELPPPSNPNVEGTPRRACREFVTGFGEQDCEKYTPVPLFPLGVGRQSGPPN